MNAAVAASLIMSVIPAHLMRSVGGGYDNESVAMTAMCLTFWLWCRSLRSRESWPIGALAGLAYIYMVATWGGFIFVLNIIGAHAALLVLFGRYSSSLHRAYSLWYVIGTIGATRVPVVGFAPLRSLEQLAPGAIFLGLQLVELSEMVRRYRKVTGWGAWKLRGQIFGLAAAASVAGCVALFSAGYFGPISSRVRGLFVKHTRTGNPLVDSVAEHQPASANAYWHYLHYTTYAAPVGLVLCLLFQLTDAKFFISLYACFAYFFSSKMVRLIIFLGPVASALAGVALGFAIDATAPPLVDALLGVAGGSASTRRGDVPTGAKETPGASEAFTSKKGKRAGSGKKSGSNGSSTVDEEKILAAAVAESRRKGGLGALTASRSASGKRRHTKSGGGGVPLVGGVIKSVDALVELARETIDAAADALRSPKLRVARTVVAAAALAAVVHYYKQFSDYAWSLAEGMSQPSIMFRAHLRDGEWHHLLVFVSFAAL